MLRISRLRENKWSLERLVKPNLKRRRKVAANYTNLKKFMRIK